VSLNIEVPYSGGAGGYLPTTGGALTGPLALGANKITGLANGTAVTDAATFGQVQTTEAALNPALQYQDLLGWTFDPVSIDGNLNYNGAAQLMLSRIPLPASITVTNVITNLKTLGLTLTHSYLALFKSDGTVIGQTADQSTAWGALGATGFYTLPLAGGPYVCTPLAANDFLWAAWYVGTAVTAPSFPVAADNYTSILIGQTAARLRSGTIAQANTATLGSIVPGNIYPSGSLYWFGIS
jgi:hypothetical protein